MIAEKADRVRDIIKSTDGAETPRMQHTGAGTRLLLHHFSLVFVELP